jgi:hypothetical protein
MKKSSYRNNIVLVFSILSIAICLTDCKKTENPIKFPKGTFPDTVVNIQDLNSAYDDYNLALYQLYGILPVVFSSNRQSAGGQFDLEQASISFIFDQTNGNFSLPAEMTDDVFLSKLINKAKTPGNDFGPYRLFSSLDGFEYLILSSVNGEGNLDLFYLKNRPANGSNLPDIEGPYPIKLLNTASDDAYICFDSNLDSAYFASDKDGNFDIFVQKRPPEKELALWFDSDYTVSTRVDSVNSTSEDKCPMVFRKHMIFASDRPGGLGGFDLYYSVFKNGNWSSPVNLGPGINTSSNEYRPVIGTLPDYTNQFMMFSSDRPGGKGGFDLYFTGIEFPE